MLTQFTENRVLHEQYLGSAIIGFLDDHAMEVRETQCGVTYWCKYNADLGELLYATQETFPVDVDGFEREVEVSAHGFLRFTFRFPTPKVFPSNRFEIACM